MKKNRADVAMFDAIGARFAHLPASERIVAISAYCAETRASNPSRIAAALAVERELAALANNPKGKLMHTNSQSQARPAVPAALAMAAQRPQPAIVAMQDVRRVFDKMLRHGVNALSADERTVLRNTMSTTTPAEGGYTVPSPVWAGVNATLKKYDAVRSVATVIPLTSGATMVYPLSDGTAEIGERLAQNVTATSADTTFGARSIPDYRTSSKAFAVPFELANDAAFNFLDWLEVRALERISRAQLIDFTTGTGTGQPGGVVTRAVAGKVGITGQTTTIIYDDLVDLMVSIDPAYRVNACWMLSDLALQMVLKVKDTAGQPMFKSGEKILNYPFVINNAMASPAANAKSILFGDFSRYVITDVGEPTIYRMTDSAYAKVGQIGFVTYVRSGGDLCDTGGAIKYYQQSAT